MGKVACDIWEKWVAVGQTQKKRIKGEIWEKWRATYGRNGLRWVERSKDRVAPERLEEWEDARGRIVPVEKDGAVVRQVERALVDLHALAVHGAIVVAGAHRRLKLLTLDPCEKKKKTSGILVEWFDPEGKGSRVRVPV